MLLAHARKDAVCAEEVRPHDADGKPTARVSGTAGTRGIPFGAVARLLVDLPSPAPESALQREAKVIRSAVAAARHHPDRLLVVDDVHQLDEPSALLVQHLVLDGSAPVLATVRSGEALPPTISSLWKDGHAERIDL